MRGRPDDWTPIVSRNWPKLVGYVVSSRHPSCLRMAKDEVTFIRRNLKQVLLAEVPRLEPKEPWFMAVIVCRGDDLTGLAQWARSIEGSRVHFYLHADAEPSLLKPWRDAGHALGRVNVGYKSYGPMHKQLGLDLGDQVYGDFAPR